MSDAADCFNGDQSRVGFHTERGKRAGGSDIVGRRVPVTGGGWSEGDGGLGKMMLVSKAYQHVRLRVMHGIEKTAYFAEPSKTSCAKRKLRDH